MSVQSVGTFRAPVQNARPQGPVGGGLFDPPPPQNPLQALQNVFAPPPRNPLQQLGDMFTPQQQNPFQQIANVFQPRRQNVFEQLYDKVFTPSDPFARMNYEAQKMQRIMNGGSTIDWMRLGAIGGGALAAVQIVGKMMRNPPEGFVMLLMAGAGAFGGNAIYDWIKTKM